MLTGPWELPLAVVTTRWGHHRGTSAYYRFTYVKLAPVPYFDGDGRVTLEVEDDVPLWELIETIDELKAAGFTDVAIAPAPVLRRWP